MKQSVNLKLSSLHFFHSLIRELVAVDISKKATIGCLEFFGFTEVEAPSLFFLCAYNLNLVSVKVTKCLPVNIKISNFTSLWVLLDCAHVKLFPSRASTMATVVPQEKKKLFFFHRRIKCIVQTMLTIDFSETYTSFTEVKTKQLVRSKTRYLLHSDSTQIWFLHSLTINSPWRFACVFTFRAMRHHFILLSHKCISYHSIISHVSAPFRCTIHPVDAPVKRCSFSAVS